MEKHMARTKKDISDEMFDLIKKNKSCSEEFIRTTLDIGTTNFRASVSILLNNDSITRIGVGKDSIYIIQTKDPKKVVLDDIKKNNLTQCADIMKRCTLTRLQILKAIDALIDQKKIFRFKMHTSNSILYSIWQKNDGARALDAAGEIKVKSSGSSIFEDMTIDRTYLKSFLRGEMHLVKTQA
jgi:hypothetical protein